MKVGPTPYCSTGGVINWSHYAESGETAILLVAEDTREPLLHMTVAPHPPNRRAGPDEVWLRDWSEAQGVPEALVEAGVVVLTGELAPLGRVQARLGVLTPEAKAELALAYAGNAGKAADRDRARARP